jgi:hypothetical protein
VTGLENLSLSAHSFRHFGDTFGVMYDIRRDPVEADCESVFLTASRPMQVGTPKRFKSRPIDQATPTVSSALKMRAKGPGQGAEVDAEEDDAFDPLTNLSFNLELLREAVEDVDVRAKQQTNHQVLEAAVLGDQLHDARIRLGKNPGVLIDPDDSAWDAISTLYGKQTQLEEGLAAGLAQLISHRLSVFAGTLDNEIHMKVDASLGPILAEQATMQRELMTTKKRLTTVENQLSNSLPRETFQGDWLMVVNFFAWHKHPQFSTIGDKIDTAMASNTGAAGGNQICSHDAVVGILQKEMQDIRDRLVSTYVTMGNLAFPTLEITTTWTTLELPQDPNDALIRVDAVTLFHSIGTEFATTSETRDHIYQNKNAGLLTLSLVLHSSFNTSLPQVLGSKNQVGGGDKGVLLLCAKTYSEWYSDSEGIVSGVKPIIEEGLKTQIIFYQGAIEEVSYTHPAAASIATTVLDILSSFGISS